MSGSTSVRPAVFHILLALSGGDLHGLGIAKAVDDATEGSFPLGPGTLYRSLKEMAADGLVADTAAPSAESLTAPASRCSSARPPATTS